MSESPFERLARLALRYGDDAMRECVEAALDLGNDHDPEYVRAVAVAINEGGIIPESEEIPTQRGRPSTPDAGLMVVWACVEAIRQTHKLSINAACGKLAEQRGTRRNPRPGGVSLKTDSGLLCWNGKDNLRKMHREAVKKREQDKDFCTVSNAVFPNILRRIARSPKLGRKP